MKTETHPLAARSTLSNIRLATPSDVPLILAFIQELAAYEKLSDEVSATEAMLAKNLFGKKRYAECLIGDVDGEPAGFALFFHNFSTFLAQPGLYLEDLYIRPPYRSRGLGMQFFRALGRLALARDCGRMEWWVLDWNEPALQFYKKLGARSMQEWTVQRLTRSEIEKLADG